MQIELSAAQLTASHSATLRNSTLTTPFSQQKLQATEILMPLNFLSRFHQTAFLTLILTAVGGCSSSEFSPVSGVVTANGTPVPKGRVTFHPKSPEGRRATGLISEDGTYSLMTKEPGDGAKPGEYTVTVEAVETTYDGPRPKDVMEEMAGIGAKTKAIRKILVAEKYFAIDTTTLTATVEDGSNKIDFPLDKE